MVAMMRKLARVFARRQGGAKTAVGPTKRRYDSPEQERIAKDVLRKHEKALRELAK